jgi:molybdate transport system ATP-binding protein
MDQVNALPLISLHNATLRVRNRRFLQHASWEIREGEHWAVVGPNGAGKSTLVKAFSGETPVVAGKIRKDDRLSRENAVAYVSFDEHRRLMDRAEAAADAGHFAGDADFTPTVREVFFQNSRRPSDIRLKETFGALEIDDALLDRDLRALSTGEIRKVIIARALLPEPPLLLILDEPFDGLDEPARRRFCDMIDRLGESGITLIFITHHPDEIPKEIRRVLHLEKGRIVSQGPASAFFNKAAPPPEAQLCRRKNRCVARGRITDGAQPLIEMKNVNVGYNGVPVLRAVNWRTVPGEHWAVAGPNGAGKSTLLALVSADHPQAYANDVRLFGRRRGKGESIWEIKEKIGVFTPGQTLRHRKPITALEAVLSGFFDTTGLYRQATKTQTARADEWMARLSITHLRNHPLDHLSYGERRLTLIARAVVKSPRLLVLDEPCRGLDNENRRRVLDLIDEITVATDTQILFVTHRADEIPAGITHLLRLIPTPGGSVAETCTVGEDDRSSPAITPAG